MSPNIPLLTGEQKNSSEKPTLDKIVAELLADKEIAEHYPDPDEQGRVIVDRFIGSLVRQGDIEGSKSTYSPIDTLNLIDNVNDGEGLDLVTNRSKVRDAVEALGLDHRTAKMFGHFSDRLTVTEDSEGNELLAMTNSAQVEGFLRAGGRANEKNDPTGGVHMSGDQWIPVFVEQVDRMARDPHIKWISDQDAYGLIESSGRLQNNSGNDWRRAKSTAESVGVDMDLLKRSAENIQKRVVEGMHMADIAFSPSYKGRITNYQKDLNRRSF